MPLHHRDPLPAVGLTWRVGVPRTRVWQCLTEPELLGQWLGELVSGTVAPGSGFVVDHGDGYRCTSTVGAFEAPARLGFTWNFPDEPASEVALELVEPDGPDGETELRLTHRALGDLAESYRDGWCVHLSYLEAAAHGTPLPSSMFWPLHGTVTALSAG